jgi:hypothetical protein
MELKSVFNIGLFGEEMVSFAPPAALPPGRITHHSFYSKLDGLQSPFGHFGQETNFTLLPRSEPYSKNLSHIQVCRQL